MIAIGRHASFILAFVSEQSGKQSASLSWPLLFGLAVILKPETFEGLRFDFTRPLNQNFAVCHRHAVHLPPLQLHGACALQPHSWLACDCDYHSSLHH